MEEILTDIAGKFLGKNVRYETPEKHDSSLLVPIPRIFGRIKANINARFIGYDVWHAYEFSFLQKSGMPVTGVLKICYPCTSKNIIESKSLKLYLNSFDLERFENDAEVLKIVKEDLTSAVGVDVMAYLHLVGVSYLYGDIFKESFQTIDSLNILVDSFVENPDLLQTAFDNTDSDPFTFHTANLRSNCEITNQKDTGNCYIYMDGRSYPNVFELARYIFSMRKAQHFHENVTEIIYNTLYNKFHPEELLVANIYNRRGGIDIHPVRASSSQVIEKVMNDYDNVSLLHRKTLQS